MRASCAIAALVALAGCADRATPPSEADGSPTVYAVNYPLQYMTQRIGGDLVEVVFPCPSGVDPAYWRPDDATVASFQDADLILLNGAGYAGWTRTVSLPPSRLVDTSASFRNDYLAVQGLTHGHGPEGEHTHGGVAFTTWLDPTQAIAQAATIRDAFARRWPEHHDVFDAGFESLRADLAALDEQLSRVLAAAYGRRLLFSHPVYQYLIRRYGLDGTSLHWEPDEMPSEQQWSIVAAQPATVMIWEAEPDEAVERRLASLGVASVVFSPCANTPDDGDYLAVMEANLRNLKEMPAARREE